MGETLNIRRTDDPTLVDINTILRGTTWAFDDADADAIGTRVLHFGERGIKIVGPTKTTLNAQFDLQFGVGTVVFD